MLDTINDKAVFVDRVIISFANVKDGWAVANASRLVELINKS